MSIKLRIVKEEFPTSSNETNQGIILLPEIKQELLQDETIENNSEYVAGIKLEKKSNVKLKRTKAKLVQPCYECSQHIGSRDENIHVLKHLMEKNEIDFMFACTLCIKFTLCKGHMIEHLSITHGVFDATAIVHYLDNSGKYSELIQEKKLACFPNSQKTSAVASITCTKSCEFNFKNTPKPAGVEPKKSSKRKLQTKPPSLPHTCVKCGQMVTWNNRGNHVLRHMFEENEVDYMFACVLCGEKLALKFHAFNHLRSSHKIDTPKVDAHYLDNSEKYKHLVQQNIIACFEPSIETDFKKINNILESLPVVKRSKPTKSGSKIDRRKVKCQACNAVVSLEKRYMTVHLLQHLQKKNILDYVVECLLCPPDRKHTSLRLKNLIGEHLKLVHQIHPAYGTPAEENVHYLNHIEKYHNLLLIEEKRCFPFIEQGNLKTEEKLSQRW